MYDCNEQCIYLCNIRDVLVICRDILKVLDECVAFCIFAFLSQVGNIVVFTCDVFYILQNFGSCIQWQITH